MADEQERLRTINASYNEYKASLTYPSSNFGGSGTSQGRGLTSTQAPQSLGQAFDNFARATGQALEPVTDNTFGTTFGRAYEEIPSISKNALNYQLSQNPENRRILKFTDENGRFNIHHVAPSAVYGDDFLNLTPEERGKRIKQVEAEQIQEAYANAGSNPWGTVTGSVTGAVADPTTVLIPGGGSIRGAAAIGAGIGATDMALESKLRDGEIDGSDVLLGAAFGGVAAGAIYLGGKVVSSLLTDAITSKIPVKPEELRERLKASGVSDGEMPDTDVIATQFNEAIGLGKDQSIAKVKEAIKFQGTHIPVESPESLYRSVSAMLDTFSDDLTPRERSFLEKAQKLYKSLSEGTKYKPRAEQYTTKKGETRFRLKRGERPFMKAYENSINRADDKIGEVYAEQVRVVEDSLGTADSISDEMLEAVSPASYVGGRTAKETAMKAVSNGEIDINGKVGRSIMPPIGKMSDPLSDQKAADMVNIGLVDIWGSTPKAVLRDKMGAAGKELADAMQQHRELTSWDVAQRTTNLERLLDSVEWYKLPRATRDTVDTQVTDILRKDLSSKDAHPMAVELAKSIEKELRGVVDDMVARGIYTPIQGAALKKKALTDGWAPRVIDHEYLSTIKGERHFKDVLLNSDLTEKEANDVIKKWSKEVSGSPVYKTKAGKYRLSPGTVAKMYRSRLREGKRFISGHIEKERTLGLPDRVLKPFLRNNIRDILTSYYYDAYRGANAFTIFGKEGENAARMLNNIQEQYGNEAGVFATNTYSLYARVEVDGADRFATYLNQPEAQRRTLSYLKGFETTKLYTAQFLGTTQAQINGSIYLASRQGLPKALLNTYKGLYKTFTEAGTEFADRSGAALQSQIMQISHAQGDIPSKFSGWFLKWTGFQLVENIQRNVGANIGRAYVEDLLATKARLLAQRNARGLSEAGERQLNKTNAQLLEMGIADGKEVTVKDMQIAAQRFSNEINFATGGDQLPLGWQTPYANLITQFKSFALWQGKFLKDNIVVPMKKGDFSGAANALIAFGLAPATAGGLPVLISELRKKWYSGEYSESDWDTVLSAYASIGGLGLIFDMAFKTANTTPERFIGSTIAGPAANTVARLTVGTGNTVASLFSEDEKFTTEPLIRAILKEVPGGHKVRDIVYDKTPEGYSSDYESSYKGMQSPR